MDQDLSKQTPRDCYDSDGGAGCTSSLREISLIETVTSFLAENGAAEVDPRVLKNLAEALSKRIDSDDISPDRIQDETLENSYNSFDAGRKPGGIHSPLQGRSMRELEEQMSTLRKENFNLKLRIYFMEESQHGTRGKTADSTLSKQLIDSKIEIELLRKRVDEKTELLKDAARAISQHEDAQKRSDIESQAMIEQMQQYIYQLESDAKQKATKNSLDNLSTEKLKSLEPEVLKLQNVIIEAEQREYEARRQLELMENELAERQESLTACEAKIEELAIKNAELVEQIEKHSELQTLSNSVITRQKFELSACLNENRRLITDLSCSEQKVQIQSKWMDDAVNILDVQRQTINNLNTEKDRAHRRLYVQLIEYENDKSKPISTVDLASQGKQFFQDLTKQLQTDENSTINCADRAAILHPLSVAKLREFHRNIISSSQSQSQSQSNLSSTYSFCFDRHGFPCFRPIKKFTFSMSEYCRDPNLPLSVAAPSTAFHNYSLLPFAGLCQLLYHWCYPSHTTN